MQRWAVAVAQLVERSLPIPEVRGSIPVISNILYRTFAANCFEKTKINKKRPRMAHFLKNATMFCLSLRLSLGRSFDLFDPS